MADQIGKLSDCFLICDLDGTLSNGSHRAFLRGDWEEFYATVSDDKVFPTIVELIAALADVTKIVLITSRPLSCRSTTLRWLEKHGIDELVEDVLFREDGRYGTDLENKIAIMETFFDGWENVKKSVWLILDDDAKTVAGLRELDLSVWQVREGDY